MLTHKSCSAATHSIPAGAVEQESEIQFEIRPMLVARCLAAFVILLTAVGAAANFVIYNVASHPEDDLARVMRRFDLGHEPSIPALYSSLALMASAVLLGLIAVARQRQHARYVKHWFGLAFLFVAFSIDECVMFHEMVDTGLSRLLDSHGFLHFAWVIPGSLLAAAVGVTYIGFLAHLDKVTRWLFIGSGALFVFGAIGMEMVAGVIAETHGLDSIQHTISQTIEEGCEMLAVVLFVYALLRYLEHHFHGIQFRVKSPSTSGQDGNAMPMMDKTT